MSTAALMQQQQQVLTSDDQWTPDSLSGNIQAFGFPEIPPLLLACFTVVALQ
jgi:hypothetical protein